ncbi:LuxR C-terminal-related transcriptional regulator [Clostridium sp.]|uniref:LuxR C-terminal-related transcriptional regulator n=1 Tax=Clostridium sp. TaxID=1506 RepID=UPI00262AF732|nr:LuxR C-terminal-related transcriptional regulator [Clostridium sp.]
MRSQIYRPKILHRKRIDDMLSQIFEGPIFFISASMGYGKTTSVKSFLDKKKDVQTIWFDTANEENDDICMWYKFCNSMKSTCSNLSKRLRSYGFPKNNMDLYKIIDTIKEEIKQRTVFIIDDWYDTKITYINQFIKALAFSEIPNFHMVIISRNKPDDQYHELELKQKCLVMRQDDIAFDYNETIEFFEINGINLSQEEKEEVYSYTGGWTSATYLALLQYNSTKTLHNIPKATEIIKTAVFDKFDEITKQILLKLSQVENFTLEQAMYVTENEMAGEVIKELLSNNCFIKYNDKSKLYTFHAILKSALKEEFLLWNIDSNRINNACGDWYSNNFQDSRAMEYYFKAKNYYRILDLIERNKTIDLTMSWKKIIAPVFNELSLEEKVNRPISYLIYIFFYIIYVDPIAGKELLYELWVIYEVNDDLNDRKQVLGEITFLESILLIDNTKKMTEYHKKAYELLQGGTSKIANNKMPVTFGSPHLLCLFHREKGELKSLADHLKNELTYFIHISNGGAAGIDYIISAEYFFETGDVDNSELYAYKALYKARAKRQISIIICALFLLMRIHINKDNIYRFRSKYRSLIEEYKNLNIPKYLNGTELALRYVDGITGNLKCIDKWIEDTESLNMQIISPSIRMNYIISAFSMVIKKSYIELEVHAEIMLEAYSRKNIIFGILYAHIFDSIAKYNLYGLDDAKKSLIKAISLAEDDNIIMSFIELSPHILPILNELKNENKYAEMLFPKCRKFSEIYKKINSEAEMVELTPRELEIMRLVHEGYKQIDISKKLNIALVTVKKHIASVYYKLDVKNKIVAINLLKEKGII